MKQLEIVLTKDEYGVTATNEVSGTVDYFDDSDDGRRSFIEYMLSEFINREVEGGRSYR